MVYVRPRTFCCCLPVRLGVFFLSIVGLLGAGFIAGAAWWQIKQLYAQPSTKPDIAIWIHAVTFSLVALVSLLGLLGACFRSRRAMTVYWIVLTTVLLLSIGSGAYTIYTIFARNSTNAILNCINADQLTRDVCAKSLKIIQWVIVAIYAVTWLLELYAITVVYSYSSQLLDEQRAKARGHSFSSISNPAPLTMYNSVGAPGQNNGYAFSRVDNSHGGFVTNPRPVPGRQGAERTYLTSIV